ncbi:4Fe-4S dicluster domain-containing protein [candidate division KSB3 bacterium]|uniref:4Fe-4S dicluster domain-containing protein n=1 Tax=candidate division KSB3 bacterium TaxID=2044937 RepID=A0A9D5JS07_9BACT|nr:4Fe-4S dicluster domain-containing protein [candidate division KSB3 bacterium]MBD3323192.1 4Fe-4S dicluster domain-containing protein [candidate division KSB3 bacterium]
MQRKIINIDESLCNGCGLCIPSCQEQALQLVETPDGKKARLVKEIYCDGLGACLGTCPTGALTIEEREAEAFDEQATEAYVQTGGAQSATATTQQQEQPMPPGGCPSARMFQWDTSESEANAPSVPTTARQSELRQWPVQLHLVNLQAAYFRHAELIIAADCVPFAYGDFHQEFLKGEGKAIVVGCPKLDDTQAYLQKLVQIIAIGQPRSITIVNMEVPCCFGLVHLVEQAMEIAGQDVPVKTTTISIKGDKLT